MNRKTDRKKEQEKRERELAYLAKGGQQVLNSLSARGREAFITLVDRVDEHLVVTGKSVIRLAAECGYDNQNTRRSWWYVMRHNVLRKNYTPTMRTVYRLSMATGLSVPELFEEFR